MEPRGMESTTAHMTDLAAFNMVSRRLSPSVDEHCRFSLVMFRPAKQSSRLKLFWGTVRGVRLAKSLENRKLLCTWGCQLLALQTPLGPVCPHGHTRQL